MSFDPVAWRAKINNPNYMNEAVTSISIDLAKEIDNKIPILTDDEIKEYKLTLEKHKYITTVGAHYKITIDKKCVGYASTITEARKIRHDYFKNGRKII